MRGILDKPNDRPSAVVDKPSRFRISTFNALRHRDYLLLWIGILFTSAGMWMETVAISWLVYDLTGSALMLGLVNGLRSVPFLIIGPLGGVAADRMDRKQLMLVTTWALLGLYVALTAIIAAGRLEIWHLFAFSVITGVCWVFNMPARQAMIPLLVPKADVSNAIALQSTAFNATRILGPAAGGILMGWLGPASTMGLVAATWIGVIATTQMLRPPIGEAPLQSRNMWQDMGDGFVHIWNNHVVLTLLLIALVPMVLAMPYFTLMPVFAKDVFHMDASGLGLLLSASGIGALVGSLGVASMGDFRKKGLALLICGVAFGAFIVLFAFSTWFPAALLFLVLLGGFSMAFMALTNTLLQLAVPNQYLGRVMAIYMLDRGLMPLGSLIAGGLADAFSAPIAVGAMGGACTVLAVAALLRLNNIRDLE